MATSNGNFDSTDQFEKHAVYAGKYKIWQRCLTDDFQHSECPKKSLTRLH